MHSHIDNFSSKNRKKLQDLCEPIYLTFGINYFFMQSTTPDGHLGCLGNNPDVMHAYIENKYYLENPFITNFNDLSSGLYFYGAVENPKLQSGLNFLEMNHKVKHCCVFVEKNEKYTQQWGLGISALKKESSLLILNQIPLIKKFIIYFNNELSFLIADVLNNRIDISKEISPIKNAVPKIEISRKDKFNFLSKLGEKNEFIQQVQLTKREIECLKYYIRGKSSQLIAPKLSISKRTVEHYLENIKNKFGCMNKSELFDTLFTLKDLNIYPEIFE